MLKSPNDNSEYSTFLLNNGLRVYLIQDPEISEAAASMKVGVGANQDPNDIPGLAHLLEHMLFNGTKKYPNENEFQDFISKNNGHTNAHTSGDHTCYHYTVSPKKILESLEMFGDFFANPLLNENSIDREKEAVNSEHEKNILDDGRIKHYLMKTMCDKECWYSKFTTGNKDTLGFPDVGKKVKEFYETYYSADIMVLSVIFKDNIDDVKKIIENIFSQIKFHPVPNLMQNVPYFTQSKVVKYVPVKNEETISLHWDIPSFVKTPKQDSNIFLSHILGNEAKNTIYSTLYDKGYIKELVSGPHSDENRSLFYVEMKLTPLGFDNINFIIDVIYEYINLLKNNIDSEIIQTLYQEQKELAKYHVTFYKKPSSLNRVLGLSLSNKYINPNEILIFDSLIDDYNQSIKDNMLLSLNEMKPEKCVILIGSHKFKNKDNSILEYYGAEYKFDNEILYPSNNKILISMPEPNPYLSTGTEIQKFEKYDKPLLLRDDKIKGSWYPDTSFQTPDAIISMEILFNNLEREPKKIVTAILYFITVKQCMNHELYQMLTGGFNINISLQSFLHKNKLYFDVSGNYQKINSVFNTIIDSLLNLELDENVFNIKKHFLKMDCQNYIYTTPYLRVNGELFDTIMHKSNISKNMILEFIDNIRFEDIKNIKGELFSSGEIIMFGCGNLNQNEFVNLMNTADKLFQNHNENILVEYKIPQWKDFTYKKFNENDKEINSVTAHYVYLDSQSINDVQNYHNYLYSYTTSKVLDSIISSDFFDTLRTKECYGYVVFSGHQHTFNNDTKQLYYMFLAQSSDKDFDNMTERIDKYMDEFYEKLQKITQEEIEYICGPIIDKLLAPCDSLNSKFYKVFYNVERNKYIEKDKIQIDFYKNMKKENVVKYYQDKFLNRKSIVIGFQEKHK
jgi:insulysin